MIAASVLSAPGDIFTAGSTTLLRPFGLPPGLPLTPFTNGLPMTPMVLSFAAGVDVSKR